MTSRSYTELKALRNRVLRATGDRNWATVDAAFRKMTPIELKKLQADARLMAVRIEKYLGEWPQAGDRDE